MKRAELDVLRDKYARLVAAPYAVEAVDELPTTHPFVVGPKHVSEAADHHGGMLGDAVIEKIGCAECGAPGSAHTWDRTLFIRVPEKLDGKLPDDLADTVRAILPEVEKDGIEGFAFLEPGRTHRMWRD